MKIALLVFLSEERRLGFRNEIRLMLSLVIQRIVMEPQSVNKGTLMLNTLRESGRVLFLEYSVLLPSMMAILLKCEFI